MGQASPGKILLVDDEPDFVKVATWRLEREGFEVLTASNGQEGLKLAQEAKPDVILLDYMMPNMNGYVVMEKLKSSPITQHIPIIILTAIGNEDKMADSIHRGAACHMPKPYDAKDMVHEIKLAIAKYRQR